MVGGILFDSDVLGRVTYFSEQVPVGTIFASGCGHAHSNVGQVAQNKLSIFVLLSG